MSGQSVGLHILKSDAPDVYKVDLHYWQRAANCSAKDIHLLFPLGS